MQGEEGGCGAGAARGGQGTASSGRCAGGGALVRRAGAAAESPWTARRYNQSILKEIRPGCSLEGMMLKLKLQYFGHLM